MTQRHKEMNWLPELRRALDEDNFCLLVQPIARIEPGSNALGIDHYEFLLRLIGTDDHIITPYAFIKAAERYDLMREIDRWVIQHAFTLIHSQHQTDKATCSFSINLSGQSIADATLLPFIAGQFEKIHIDPRFVWFEITETAAISHYSIAVEQVNGLRKLGCKVALDDFGSGLSSFGYLKNFPVDVLKIDGQFVREIASNSVDLEMVHAFARIGKALGVETIAEFVEDEAVLKTLAEIGIDYAQGYYIGAPMPLEQAINHSRRRAA